MTTAHEDDQGEAFLTPVQSRKRAGVSHRTFQRYRAAGLIKPAHVLPNGHARFRAADVDALLVAVADDEQPGQDDDVVTPRTAAAASA